MTDQPNTTPHPCEAVQIDGELEVVTRNRDDADLTREYATIYRLRAALHAAEAQSAQDWEKWAAAVVKRDDTIAQLRAEVERLRASGWRDAGEALTHHVGVAMSTAWAIQQQNGDDTRLRKVAPMLAVIEKRCRRAMDILQPLPSPPKEADDA